jgi:hypothetical protein
VHARPTSLEVLAGIAHGYFILRADHASAAASGGSARFGAASATTSSCSANFCSTASKAVENTLPRGWKANLVWQGNHSNADVLFELLKPAASQPRTGDWL